MKNFRINTFVSTLIAAISVLVICGIAVYSLLPNQKEWKQEVTVPLSNFVLEKNNDLMTNIYNKLEECSKTQRKEECFETLKEYSKVYQQEDIFNELNQKYEVLQKDFYAKRK